MIDCLHPFLEAEFFFYMQLKVVVGPSNKVNLLVKLP
jgi:hypothetical protein